MLRAPPVKFTGRGPPRPRRQIPPALRAPRGPPSKASIPGGPRQNHKRLGPLLPLYAYRRTYFYYASTWLHAPDRQAQPRPPKMWARDALGLARGAHRGA